VITKNLFSIAPWQERKKPQHRKNLDQIDGVLSSATQATRSDPASARHCRVRDALSETYRTCERAGCHCQSGGPKHGPHLNISYRGEKGKTTGYYVPQGAEEATREGVVAWQKLQACLRELAELNKERNLRQARERDSR